MEEPTLLINEIFHSIQGESSWSGKPCTFIRLKGCPLRCHYCDTSYAFNEGCSQNITSILKKIELYKCRLVELTGGEPLLQKNIYLLMDALIERSYTVLVETSGQIDISRCSPKVHRIVDIKTPGSGAANSFLEKNYEYITAYDEVKFVITDLDDFNWSIDQVKNNNLIQSAGEVLFSPVVQQEGNEFIRGCQSLDPDLLAKWILESDLPIRLQLQVHKKIWHPNKRGV
ncbi:MAG TPA: 7-carboxy-7-deazaguanine synthase [Opitutae bacterium]|nr:7-carboxy-7-deazaguanine synthase [Opitutae bacterium]